MSESVGHQHELSHGGVKVVDVLKAVDGSLKIISDARNLSRPSIETGRYIQPCDAGEFEDVVCLSSQIGCNMECSFCASTTPFIYKEGDISRRLFGSLSADEIIGQAQNALTIMPAEQRGGLVFSFMGMGEPMLNFEAISGAIHNLSRLYPDSRATICTMLPERIGPKNAKYLADQIASGVFSNPVKLHISLHASSDISRAELLPKAEPISVAIETGKYFMEKTKTNVKMNYVLVAGFNDSLDDAVKLGGLLKGTGLTLKLSDLNPYDSPQRVPAQQASEFASAVESYGVKTVRFTSNGPDIEAGCGQFIKSNPSSLVAIGASALAKS